MRGGLGQRRGARVPVCFLFLLWKDSIMFITDTNVSDLLRARDRGEAPPVGASSPIRATSALVLGKDGNYHWQDIPAVRTGVPIPLNGNGHHNGNGKKK